MTVVEAAPERRRHYQAVLDAYQSVRRLPTLVAGVLEGGALVWTGTAGMDASVDAQYRIGSITKTMTAVLVMQSRDEGLLDLDDRVAETVPESGYRDVTVRQLLSHSSGMQSEPVGSWWERSPGTDFETLVAANDGSGAVFPPGSTYHYSNLGFALLGEIVARLRGRPWHEVLQTDLLTPLGLTRTSYLPQAPVASGFSVDHFAGSLTAEPAVDTGAMAPAGQVWSTVPDLARFLAFLIEGPDRVLAGRSREEMTRSSGPDPTYGLGTKVFEHVGRRFVGHLGSMPGYQSVALIDGDSGSGVVALTNATTGFMGPELTVRLLGTDTPSPGQPWHPSTRVPEWVVELLGMWFWGNSAFEVRWHNGLLEFHDCARGVLAEKFDRVEGRILGVAGYHHGETLRVIRRGDGTVRNLECATFVYTRAPYDPEVTIPGGHPRADSDEREFR